MYKEIKDFKKLVSAYMEKRHLHNQMLANAFKIIANYGWYISEDIPMDKITVLYGFAFEEKEEDINVFFQKFYMENLEKNIEKLQNRHSSRSHLILEAYESYKNRCYHASILLSLTIADGICSGELFKIKKNKTSIKKFLENNKTPETLSIFLGVLTEVNSIDVYYPFKSKFKSQLNRHGIIHGYDIEYGSELNSLKAFSLLIFVNDMINRHKREI